MARSTEVNFSHRRSHRQQWNSLALDGSAQNVRQEISGWVIRLYECADQGDHAQRTKLRYSSTPTTHLRRRTKTCIMILDPLVTQEASNIKMKSLKSQTHQNQKYRNKIDREIEGTCRNQNLAAKYQRIDRRRKNDEIGQKSTQMSRSAEN